MDRSLDLLENNGPKVRAVRAIRSYIRDGKFTAGDPLPSERDLAVRLSVNRGTLRSALEQLTDEGLIEFEGTRRRVVAYAALPAPSSTESTWIVSNAIAVLSPHNYPRPTWINHTGMTLATTTSLLQEIEDSGRHAIKLHPHNGAREIDELISHRPAGVVCVFNLENLSTLLPDAVRLQDAGVNVAVLGDMPETERFDRVVSDHEFGGYLLTRWMIEQGRKRIVQLWPAELDLYWLNQRRLGYLRAMTEAGLEPIDLIKSLPFEAVPEEKFRDRARHLAGYLIELVGRKQNIDGIQVASDGYLSSASAMCKILGLWPNEDVSICGYDNFWTVCAEQEWEPIVPDATVDKLNPEIGRQVVRGLIGRIDGTKTGPPQTKVVKPVLITNLTPSKH